MERFELIFIALITILGSLSCAFGDETTNDLNQGLAVPTCGHINASETQLLNSTVELNVAYATFILSWENETTDLEIVLITPSGMVIDHAAEKPIIYQKNASLISYMIPNPEPGNWTSKITAMAVPEMGENYCVFTILDEGVATVLDSSSNISDVAPDVGECETCRSQ